MPLTIRQEFACRNFSPRCSDDERNQFLQSQWFSDRRIFLFYRALIWAYHSGWTIAFFAWTRIHKPDRLAKSHWYFTNWGDGVNLIYYTCSFVLCVESFHRRNGVEHDGERILRWLRPLTWLFHNLAVTSSIVVTAVYYGLVAPKFGADQLLNPFSIHRHTFNTVLILTDLCVVATPVRLLHCVYEMLYGVVYTLATLCIHWSGTTSAVYPFLNWALTPGKAAGIAVATGLAAPLLLQPFIYALYRLRVKVYQTRKSSRALQRDTAQKCYVAGTEYNETSSGPEEVCC